MNDTIHQIFQDGDAYKIRITRLGEFMQEADGFSSYANAASWIAQAQRPTGSRPPDRLYLSGRRHCDDAVAGMGRGLHPCCGRCLRRPPGFGEGARIPTPQDHLRPRHAGERNDDEDQFKKLPRERFCTGGRSVI